jgi:hypothetical protein
MNSKKSFDQLVVEIQPLMEDQQGKLVGGFSQYSASSLDEKTNLNEQCTNNQCNTAAGCSTLND